MSRGWRAVRVMKARHDSTCPICRAPITVGQQIARRGIGPWQHIGHVTDALETIRERRETAP